MSKKHRLSPATVALVVAAACRNAPAFVLQPPLAGAHCYEVEYSASVRGMFPGLLILDPGQDSAAAYWPPTAADSTGIWRMFYRGSWARVRGQDSVAIRFDNGFTWIGLRVGPIGGSVLTGAATWHSDVIDTLPPPQSAMTGSRIACAGPGRPA